MPAAGSRFSLLLSFFSFAFSFLLLPCDYPPVALPYGYALTVKIPEQRDRIFARDAGQIFESGNINGPVRLMIRGVFLEFRLQTIEGLLMKEEVALNSHQHASIN